MAYVIYKYEIPLTGRPFTIDLPSGAKILSAQVQYSKPVMWAIVEPGGETVKRTFKMIGTGHTGEFVGEAIRYDYIGSFQIDGGALVLHLFELHNLCSLVRDVKS